jgi:hypothetical protein
MTQRSISGFLIFIVVPAAIFGVAWEFLSLEESIAVVIGATILGLLVVRLFFVDREGA